MTDYQATSIISGAHPLMGMLGMRLLNNHKSHQVILARDVSSQWNNQFIDHICGLERAFIESWGQDEDINVMKNIKDYLQQQKLSFLIDGRALFLGSSPSRNLIEISRKFTTLFGEEQSDLINDIFSDKSARELFDERFYSLSSRIALNCFRYRTLETLTPTIFETHCPENVKNLFHSFKENLLRNEHRALVFSLRSYYHQTLSYEVGELECFHLFLSILSPHFKLDVYRFFADMLNEVEERGGKLISYEDGIEYGFQKRSFSPIDLQGHKIIGNSYNFFLGPKRFNEQIQLQSDDIVYKEAIVSIKKIENLHLANGIYFVCHEDLLGTQFPFWKLTYSQKGIEVKLLVEESECENIQLVHRRMKSFLSKEFSRFGLILEEENFSEIDFSANRYPLEWAPFEGRKSNFKLPMKNTAFFRKNNGKFLKLKNSYGFSPERGEPLGLFSLLLQIKNTDAFSL